MEDIRDTFKIFTSLGSPQGKVICCLDDAEVRKLSTQIDKEVITYGFSEDALYQITNPVFFENGSTFEIHKNRQIQTNISLHIPGRHNILNAVASFIVARQLDINTKLIEKALNSFAGVDRRFEIKGIVNGITIVDDYAHHPTEVAATIEGARSGWNNRIIIVFQPHLFTRTRDFYKDFAHALSAADEIILCDIYPAREEPIPGVSSDLIIAEAKTQGNNNFLLISKHSDIEDYLYEHLKPGDLVITMGAGDIWLSAERLLKRLKVETVEN